MPPVQSDRYECPGQAPSAMATGDSFLTSAAEDVAEHHHGGSRSRSRSRCRCRSSAGGASGRKQAGNYSYRGIVLCKVCQRVCRRCQQLRLEGHIRKVVPELHTADEAVLVLGLQDLMLLRQSNRLQVQARVSPRSPSVACLVPQVQRAAALVEGLTSSSRKTGWLPLSESIIVKDALPT
jgi:hypothetical protein